MTQSVHFVFVILGQHLNTYCGPWKCSINLPALFGLFTFSPPEQLSTDLAFQNKSVPSQNAGRIDSRLQMTSIVSCKISRLWLLNERQQQLCLTSLWKLRFLASLCRPCHAFERIIQLTVTMSLCAMAAETRSHTTGM